MPSGVVSRMKTNATNSASFEIQNQIVANAPKENHQTP